MKPLQSPSFHQVLVYDITSQRFGIYSLFIGIPSLGLLVYGLISGAFEYLWIGLAGMLVSCFEIARLIQRFRFFQNIHENGEAIRVTLEDVTLQGDEINVGGPYTHRGKECVFWTTLQKTGRTKNLTTGDQIWVVIDEDHPENFYVQDLFTPDSPEEIRQPRVQDDSRKQRQAPVFENDHYRIDVSSSAVKNQPSMQPSKLTDRNAKTRSAMLVIRDFPRGFLVIGIIVFLGGAFFQNLGEQGNGGWIAMIVGILIILTSLGSTMTITIDKNAGIMSLKSIWKRDAIEIPLNDLHDIQVEVKEGDDGDTYRLIAVKNDGTAIPFRGWYTGGLASYNKRAGQLCAFIGIGDNKS